MNIIQVCPYNLSIPGGVQTHVTHLSNNLVKRKHKVLVIAPSLKKSGFERKFDCEVIYITDAKRIGLWGTSIDISILNRKEKRHLRNVLAEFRPHAVHFHTIWNPFMQTQILNLLDPDVKRVATFHDTPPDFGVGRYIGANLMKLGAGYYMRRLDEIISVSKTQAAAMGIDEINSGDNFHLIPNGIDASLSSLEIHKEKENKKEFKLIFIGRFEKRKGLFDLLEVYKKLSSEIKDPKLSLSLLGDGPQMPKVKKLAEEQLLPNVSFYPNTGDKEKNRLLAGSDLLVAPSLYGESFGIVLLEAMALEVKVAGYGNAGYLNIGRDYGEENFPAPGDKKELFNVIRNHIIHPESTDHLAERGARIAKQHNWPLITGKIEMLYTR